MNPDKKIDRLERLRQHHVLHVPQAKTDRPFFLVYLHGCELLRPNFWRYFGSVVRIDKAGIPTRAYTTLIQSFFKPEDLDTRYLLNLNEWLNTGEGIEGDMVNVDRLVGSFALLPFRNIIVPVWKEAPGLFLFNMPNTIDGECEE